MLSEHFERSKNFSKAKFIKLTIPKHSKIFESSLLAPVQMIQTESKTFGGR